MVVKGGVMKVRIKRVYETPQPDDGKRILIDRLWPRGLTKQKAQVDLWLKDVAPSSELRTWYGHDPAKWEEFKARYYAELKNNDAVGQLKKELKEKATLVFGAKDEAHSHALALKNFLEK